MMPAKLICGTFIWFFSHTSPRVQPPPIWSACDPLIQFKVFSTTLVDASRELFVGPAIGFAIPIALLKFR